MGDENHSNFRGIGRDIYGNCNQFHVFTYTYEYNTKTHEERNKHRDTYNPE